MGGCILINVTSPSAIRQYVRCSGSDPASIGGLGSDPALLRGSRLTTEVASLADQIEGPQGLRYFWIYDKKAPGVAQVLISSGGTMLDLPAIPQRSRRNK